MNKSWFILVATFSLSLGLVTGGLIKGNIELTAAGFIIGIIIFLTQKRFK